MRSRQVRALHRVLRSSSEEDRIWALNQLGALGGRRPLGLIASTLSDRSGAVRLMAARVLRKEGWEPNDPEEKARFLVADRRWAEAASLGRASVRPLSSLLRDEDQEVRQHGARALEMTGSSNAGSFLAASLHAEDHSAETRLSIVRALAGAGGARALGTLAELVDRAAYEEIAARALRDGGELSVPHLGRLLSTGSRDQRSRAAKLLGEIGGDQARTMLLTALRTGDTETRLEAVRALEHFRNAEVKSAILSLLRSSQQETELRLAAAETVATWGEEVVPVLCDNLRRAESGHERISLIRGLGSTGSGSAADMLLDAYGEASDPEKRAIRDALVAIGEPAVPSLVEQLEQANQLTAVSEVLSRIAWRPSGEHCLLFWLGLGEWEKCITPGALPTLRLALRQNPRDPLIVSGVAAAAKGIGEPAIAEELLSWLRGPGRSEELEGTARKVDRVLRQFSPMIDEESTGRRRAKRHQARGH
jgi:HEAT repeat protein